MLLSLVHLGSEAHSRSCHDGLPFKAIHTVVGVTCVLSMIGSILIILSYFIVPDIRTKSREILVNLSLMDFMAAAANLAGIVINFDKYLGDGADNSTHHYMSHLCLAQATFALYGTLSSVLWTICIAVYIYLCIMVGSKLLAARSVLVFYVLSYGIPVIVTVWYVVTDKLGYDVVSGSGWCSLLVYKQYGEHSVAAPLTSIFANDIWVYLTMFIVPVIFISLYCHLKSEVKKNQAILSQNWKATVQSVEVKFLFIPIFFILLRIWSLVFVAIVVQGRYELPCGAVKFFLFIGGIGDSGQGFANSILYVLFTRTVRNYFLRCFLCGRGSTRNQRSKGAVLVSERPTFNSSFSSDLERKEFSDDITDSGATTDKERERKSLLLNS